MNHSHLLACKHNPTRRICIGTGANRITQWRCTCGHIVSLTDLQVMYVAELQSLLSERGFLGGLLSDEYEAAVVTRLNDFRKLMKKSEEGQLDGIIKAVVSFYPKGQVS